MSDTSQTSWSNDPYAPQISRRTYFAEKMSFAGFLIGAICYGIVIVLFFQCMIALLNSANRKKEGIKWGLVAHTFFMFSFVTIYTAASLALQSISYIDNREFPGGGGSPPGPLGYQLSNGFLGISVVQSVVFFLNGWLADGLLLHRCYVTYCGNYWAIAFPSVMFLASVAMGIAFLYQGSLHADLDLSSVSFGVPYYSISLSLNVILTLMIVGRLILHSKNFQNAMGPTAKTGGLYKAIVTILIESCALYAITYLLFMAPWAAGSSVGNAFFPILVEVQVISPYLIILRVANRKAFTGNAVVSGKITSIRFQSQGGQMGSNGTHTENHSVGSADTYGKTPDGLGVEITTVEVPYDRV